MGESSNKYLSKQRQDKAKETMAEELRKARIARRQKLTAEKGDTDSGMTAAQKKTILSLGDKIQGRATEKGYIVGANGAVQAETIRGNHNSAVFHLSPFADYSKSYLVHNHPSPTRSEEKGQLDYYKKMGINAKKFRISDPEYYEQTLARRKETLSTRVGLTLSWADVKTAANNNMAGIRARTEGGFIFSLERGKNGWGASGDVLARKLNNYLNEERAKHGSYAQFVDNFRERQERTSRKEVVSQHRALKRLADEYGLKYTRRKA